MNPASPTNPVPVAPPQPVQPMQPIVPNIPQPPAPPQMPPATMSGTVQPATPQPTAATPMMETETPPPPPTGAPPLVPTASVITSKKKGGIGKIILFVLILLLLIGGGVGAYFYFSKSGEPEETLEVVEPETESAAEGVEPVVMEIPEEEIVEVPETQNYTDQEYNFSIDYLSSWDFECLRCGAIPESSSSAWVVLEMKTFDYLVDEEEKIVRGARLTINASSDRLTPTGYTAGSYNDIAGLLNLDPSAPMQGFVYTDEESGLDIHLEWKSLTASDRADQELQRILKSFKKI